MGKIASLFLWLQIFLAFPVLIHANLSPLLHENDTLQPPLRNNSFQRTETSSIFREQKSKQKNEKNLIMERVERFTSYHIYFQSSNNRHPVSIPFDRHNLTWIDFESKIDSCPHMSYFPRKISRSHISWKASADIKNSTNRQNSNQTDATQSKNTSVPLPHNDTEANNNNTTDKSPERIHDYLILALLMPHHPFSDEFRAALSAVGPMFPHVTIITGNAYEFRDIASKYFVSDFPRAILFKNGLFHRDYAVRDPAKLAAYIAGWTRSYPRSLPAPYRLMSSQHPPSYAFLSPPPSLPWLQPLLQQLPLPYPNLEPFIGSVYYHQELDIFMFLTALVYTSGRCLFYIYGAIWHPTRPDPER